MTPEQLARLELLGNHIHHGNLAHKRFDFTVINVNQGGPDYPGYCGTNGCAFGELPALWPEQFTWGINKVISKGRGHYDICTTSLHWFGLDEHESEVLFIPDARDHRVFKPYRPGSLCVYLPGDATREPVGLNILQMVEEKKKELGLTYDKDPIIPAGEAGTPHPEGEAGAQSV